MKERVKLVSAPIPVYTNYCEHCEVSFVTWSYFPEDLNSDEVYLSQIADFCYLCGKSLGSVA